MQPAHCMPLVADLVPHQCALCLLSCLCCWCCREHYYYCAPLSMHGSCCVQRFRSAPAVPHAPPSVPAHVPRLLLAAGAPAPLHRHEEGRLLPGQEAHHVREHSWVLVSSFVIGQRWSLACGAACWRVPLLPDTRTAVEHCLRFVSNIAARRRWPTCWGARELLELTLVGTRKFIPLSLPLQQEGGDQPAGERGLLALQPVLRGAAGQDRADDQHEGMRGVAGIWWLACGGCGGPAVGGVLS